MPFEQLKLKNQLCFRLYAASRLVTRAYQPYLDALDITYPQYLVLMVLWEQDGQPVNDIAKRLHLNTNTITPLLKRMEQEGFMVRERCKTDERRVLVMLTEKGKLLEERASTIPMEMTEQLLCTNVVEMEQLHLLMPTLDRLITMLAASKTEAE